MTADDIVDANDEGGQTSPNRCASKDEVPPDDVQRVNDDSNPLLSDSDQQQSTITADGSVAKSRKTNKVDGDRIAMAKGWQKDPEAEDTNVHEPPDGGPRAWMIMIASFFINGVLFSVINTYSLIYMELQKRLMEAGETEASSKAALVGSLAIGTTFVVSPVAGILTDRIGIQTTTFLGGLLASGGMMLSSVLSDKVVFLYLTYGVMYGVGASLAYTPSLVILGHYFKRYLGLVNGIVTAGSSIFTTLMPYVMEVLLRRFGLEVTLRCLGLLTSVVMICAVLFKTVPHRPQIRTESPRRFKDAINLSIWKQKRYVVWASSIPLALFGYFVPYVHIGKFVANTFTDADGRLPVMCIGITSGIGRLIFGYIADLPKVNRILLQQISFFSIGILTMLLPVTRSFIVLLIISLGMGLFDGCFISLLGPIAFDICGRNGATQAIGFLLGMCSVPLTVGPPIAGLLYDHTGTYDLPFLLAGVPPIVGALTMFLVKCVKEENDREDNDEDSVAKNSEAKEVYQNGCAKGKILSPVFVAAAKNGSHQIGKRIVPSDNVQSRHPREQIRCRGYREGSDNTNQYSEVCRHSSTYSESMPLLYKENRESSILVTAKSSTLLTF